MSGQSYMLSHMQSGIHWMGRRVLPMCVTWFTSFTHSCTWTHIRYAGLPTPCVAMTTPAPHTQLSKERELRGRLENAMTELAPIEAQSQALVKKSTGRSNMAVWGGMAFMSLQFGFFARLTWWEYSWDIMEPVTYFATYATSMAMFAYFVITRQVSVSMWCVSHPPTHSTGLCLPSGSGKELFAQLSPNGRQTEV